MSRLTRDGTAEPVSRGQILRRVREQGNIHFTCSADLEQDWQPYPVDTYSAICDDHRYIHTYIHSYILVHSYERAGTVTSWTSQPLHLSLILNVRTPIQIWIYLFAVHGLSERTTVQTSSILPGMNMRNQPTAMDLYFLDWVRTRYKTEPETHTKSAHTVL